MRGIPLFATLIALEDEVAVVSAPALGRRWWATRGGGAFANGEPIGVSRIARLEDAVLTYTSVRDFGEAFFALARRVWAPRGFGDFWQYMLLAEGCVDVSVESRGEPLGSRGAEADRGGGGRAPHRPGRERHGGRRQRARLERAPARGDARGAQNDLSACS